MINILKEYTKNFNDISKKVLFYGLEFAVGYFLIGFILHQNEKNFKDILAAQDFARAALASGLSLIVGTVLFACFIDYFFKKYKTEK